MKVDGKTIAVRLLKEVHDEVSKRSGAPSLAVISMSPDLATQKFMEIKKKAAQDVGVSITVIHIPDGADTKVAMLAVREAAHIHDGIIVQLPLPAHIDEKAVLDAIPVTHDVDGVSSEAVKKFKDGTSLVMPPVAGAIAEVLEHHHVSVLGKRVAIVGQGKLVGAPAAIWCMREGAQIRVVTKDPQDLPLLSKADIVVLGAGVPGLLKPEMIKKGVVILDAGTSEAGGKLSGDADSSCAKKASLITPVPGGIGPITVAMIFKNLLALTKLPK